MINAFLNKSQSVMMNLWVTVQNQHQFQSDTPGSPKTIQTMLRFQLEEEEKDQGGHDSTSLISKLSVTPLDAKDASAWRPASANAEGTTKNAG